MRASLLVGWYCKISSAIYREYWLWNLRQWKLISECKILLLFLHASAKIDKFWVLYSILYLELCIFVMIFLYDLLLWYIFMSDFFNIVTSIIDLWLVNACMYIHTKIHMRITRINLSNPKTWVDDEGNKVKKMKGYHLWDYFFPYILCVVSTLLPCFPTHDSGIHDSPHPSWSIALRVNNDGQIWRY